MNPNTLKENLLPSQENINWLGRLPIEVMENEPVTDDFKRIRHLLQGVMVSLGAGATSAFWPINMRTGDVIGGGVAVGVTATVANSLAFWVLQVSSGNDVIYEKMGAKTTAEWHLSRGEIKSRGAQTVQLVAAAIMSASNAVPSVLAARFYRGESEDKRITVVVTTALGLSLTLFPFDSTYRGIGALSQSSLDPVARKLLALKGMVYKKVRNQEYVLAEKQQGYLDSLDLLVGDDHEQKAITYWDHLLDDSSVSELSAGQKRAIQIGTYAGTALGLAFTGVLGEFTYDKIKGETSDTALAATCSISVVSSNLFSIQQLIQNMTAMTALKTYNLVTWSKTNESLSRKLLPCTTVCLDVLALMNSIFALGATVVIYSDHFDKSEAEKAAGISIMGAGLFSILFNVMLANIDKVLHRVILHKGTDLEVNMVKRLRHLYRVAEGVKRASLLDAAHFAKQLSDGKYQGMLDKLELKLGELDAYISKHEKKSNAEVV